MIGAALVDTVQNTVYVKLGQVFPVWVPTFTMVLVLQNANTTIMEETGIAEGAIVEVHLLIIDAVGVKGTITTETILVRETGATMMMIMIMTEAAHEVTAEVEKGDEIVDVIERRGLVETDPAIDPTRNPETDLAKGLEIGIDLEKGLVKDLEIGLEIGIETDLGPEIEIETDRGIGETGTVKIIDREENAV